MWFFKNFIVATITSVDHARILKSMREFSSEEKRLMIDSDSGDPHEFINSEVFGGNNLATEYHLMKYGDQNYLIMATIIHKSRKKFQGIKAKYIPKQYQLSSIYKYIYTCFEKDYIEFPEKNGRKKEGEE